MVGELTHMRSMCVGVAETGVEQCSPAKNHKATFLLLALLNDQKRGKSQQGGLAPSSLRTTVLRARVSRMSRARQCVRHGIKMKVGGFAALHGFNYTTRANISHEIAEQIRARIVCTPTESAWRELAHMRSMCVGVAETGDDHLKKYQLQKGMKSVGFHALVKIPFYLLRMNAAMMLSIPKRIKYAATK